YLLLDHACVVSDVAEVPAKLRVPELRKRAVLEPVEGREQRVHRAGQLVDLLLQPVDLLRLVLLPGEDRVLELVDARLARLDDGAGRIDDDVDDRPHHSRRTALLQIVVPLEPGARLRGATCAVPDRDHVADAYEEIELAERDPVPGEPCGADDEEVEVVVRL